MGLQVRLAATDEEREAVFRFRYRVYVDELCLNPREAEHREKILHDGLDDIGLSYGLFEDGKVVGSLRILFFEDVDDLDPLIKKYNCKPALDAFSESAICATSRFMLDPNLRGGRVILKLMSAVFRDACKRGARLNFGDCSPHILPFYEHLGYRRYTRAYNDTSYGYKLPILMLIRDLERFEQVRSPLLRIAREQDNDQGARDWFEKIYPDYLGIESASFVSDEAFFDMLSACVGQDPLHSVSLFKGMGKDDVAGILKTATLIRCHNGDRIINEGERDNTLFVMLKGVAEVFSNGAADRTVAVLAAGDTFGEIGLVTELARSANVVAKSDCEVLVISGDFLQRCIQQDPEIAARLLLNLSCPLAERLSVTTSHVMANATSSLLS
ncbi:MAG: cyclic nucleotide-binding domain-containing protein [Pseudomonadota bacterium]|nr:cyclic nucleotide-binding domain-containing protein [Pseudomonadota bacterium]